MDIRAVRAAQQEADAWLLSHTALRIIDAADGKTVRQLAEVVRRQHNTVVIRVASLIRDGYLYRQDGKLYRCAWEPSTPSAVDLFQ